MQHMDISMSLFVVSKCEEKGIHLRPEEFH